MWTPPDPDAMTFTEAARRAQILRAAVDTVVDLGWTRSSLVRIAERIDASKGAILHYFRDKDALVIAVVGDVLTRLAAAIDAAATTAPDGPGRIRAHIRAHAAFIADHPRDIAALLELGAAYRTPDGRRLADLVDPADAAPPALRGLDLAGRIERELPASGQPRVDPATTAMIVRGALDAASQRRVRDPDFDPRPYGRELADTVVARLFP